MKLPNRPRHPDTFKIVDAATNEKDHPPVTPAVTRGRKGGAKGGKARAEIPTFKQRSEIAKNAAKARWNRHAEH